MRKTKLITVGFKRKALKETEIQQCLRVTCFGFVGYL
jgi:hypothetical protein